MSTQPAPQPGWYPDPGGQGQRYWNGVAWGPIAPPWQPMPPAAPSPQPKRRGVGWLIVVGVLIVCPGSCIYGLVSHDDKSARSNTTTSSRTASTPAFSAPTTSVKPAARIGQQVRDGKFAFVVTSIDRSKRGGDPSNEFMQETAQGEYLNVHMTVSNIGDRSQTFFATNQKLMTGGRQFEADTMVSVWDGSTNVDINPGNSINATASFDIPAGTPPGTIELHDSAFSGGVEVQLS